MSMSSMKNAPALPSEVILSVIECLIPSSPPVVFAPSHPVTRTLVNLTLVSRLTSRTAKRLLLKHCMYINAEERLTKLIALRQQSSTDLTAASPQGLFLAPFPAEDLDHLSIAKNVNLLLSDIGGKLTSLIINMPLRYLRPEEDLNHVRPVLREAFSSLEALEEFCSMQDELYLDIPGQQPQVWLAWPRLQRLALYNPCLDFPGFVADIKRCSNLTHLVFSRADSLFYDVPEDSAGFGGLRLLKRVIIVNTERGFLQNMRFHQEERDSKGTFLRRLRSAWFGNHAGQVRAEEMAEFDYFCVAVTVPIPPHLVDDDQIDIQLCQEWVGTHAMDGTLWDMPGTPFLVP
ncbi:hypothetical protein ACJ72_02776 [Emergomyces africanus]|uniref:Uncharacterized protein n=1 Tax=Emergomyces africanus TaxID=1955775 RepID=A0A1B7P1F3_9EURO|nr:hypothetical protein ACJ72_02776 [Emergomyces africanus]